MKKYIVLSVNYNVDYLWYLPLTVWAWRKLGWEPIIFYEAGGALTSAYQCAYSYCFFKEDEDRTWLLMPGKYRSDTISQVSRLYGACVQDGYLMTGDIDMFPLSDYWKFNENEITLWGHDLTGYGNQPICYIGMSSQKWIEVMGLSSKDYNAMIQRDLSEITKASSEKWEDYWETDQDLITKRLNATQFTKTSVIRGQLPNGYARGRVDRGNWTLDQPELIDCHALRDCYKNSDIGRLNLAKTMRLFEFVFPNDNHEWIREYTKEFQKLANNG